MTANSQTVARFVTVTMGLIHQAHLPLWGRQRVELGVEAAGTRIRSATGGASG